MTQAAAIFPGQGCQVVGMGRDAFEGSRAARVIFDRANQVLDFDLARICFEGPESELEKTDIQQPAILVTSVALWAAFMEASGSPSQFTRMGGLSLGEYTALHLAGAISFDDTVRLVRERGRLMQAAAVATPSGMISLVGADEETAQALCDRAREDEVLAPANYNCPGQVVISGSQSACDRALSLTEQFRVRGIALTVAGAFHSPLMQSAANGLAELLQKTEFHRPSVPVVANVNADYHEDPVGIRISLSRQITHPVLWQRCIERMVSDGVEKFVEIGPGKVLTGLVRKTHRQASVFNINSMASITSMAAVPVET